MISLRFKAIARTSGGLLGSFAAKTPGIGVSAGRGNEENAVCGTGIGDTGWVVAGPPADVSVSWGRELEVADVGKDSLSILLVEDKAVVEGMLDVFNATDELDWATTEVVASRRKVSHGQGRETMG